MNNGIIGGPKLDKCGLRASALGYERVRFFDQHDRFYSSSLTAPYPNRLRGRYEAIIKGNHALIRGKRILDVASHDGRWSFAALHNGCESVIGIEARPHLVANAKENFEAYAVDQRRYRFILGDVFEVLRSEKFEVDTVLLLGFFYHTDRHSELAALLAATGASHIILDGNILPDWDNPSNLPLVRLEAECTEDEGNNFVCEPTSIVGFPSRAAIKLIFGRLGFSMAEVDWSPFLSDPEHLGDYKSGARATFVLTKDVSSPKSVG